MTFQSDLKVTNLFNRLSANSVFSILLSGFIIQFAIMAIAALLSAKPASRFYDFHGLAETVLVAVLLGPLFETIIFLYALLESILDQFKSITVAILISGLAFGVSHWYSTQLIIATCFSGFLVGAVYMILKIKGKNAFLYVTMLHAASNLFIVIMKYLNGAL